MNTTTNTVSFEYTILRDRHFTSPFAGFGECEATLSLSAFVSQDSGHGFDSECLVIWTDESLATIAKHDLDSEEIAGAIEAAEYAWFDREQDQCRLASARQRQDSARGAA